MDCQIECARKGIDPEFVQQLIPHPGQGRELRRSLLAGPDAPADHFAAAARISAMILSSNSRIAARRVSCHSKLSGATVTPAQA